MFTQFANFAKNCACILAISKLCCMIYKLRKLAKHSEHIHLTYVTLERSEMNVHRENDKERERDRDREREREESCILTLANP